jgi:hypothetical protein
MWFVCAPPPTGLGRSIAEWGELTPRQASALAKQGSAKVNHPHIAAALEWQRECFAAYQAEAAAVLLANELRTGP